MTRTTQIARRLAMAALAMAVQVAFAQTRYRVVPMPLVAAEPHAMNSSGKMLASDSQTGAYFLCTKGACRVLPRDHNYEYRQWEDLNDLGMLTGYKAGPGDKHWAVRMDTSSDGEVQFLTPGGGWAIAPDGAVIGFTRESSAFLYTDHRIDLSGLARSPRPWAINSHHVIVGTSLTADNREHATMWVDGGPPQDMGTAPGHTESWALAVNDAGVAVGMSRVRYPLNLPARFVDGNVQVILLPRSSDTGEATAINNAGTIVGWFYQPSLNRYAGGIVEGDSMIDLNRRLRRKDAGRYLIVSALRINDAGQIAATAINPQTGIERAVRLEPVD